MEKLVFRTISKTDQIDFFLERFGYFVGVKLPLAYAQSNKVVGVFLHERLVGGYIIVTTPPFRSTMFVPDSIKLSDPFFGKDLYDSMEVNGVWISPSVKSAKQQFQIWKQLLKDVVLCKKKYILLMRNANNRNVDRIHRLTSPIQIYRGRPALLPGHQTHGEICISYTTRWRLLLGFQRYWQEYRHREKRQKVDIEQNIYKPSNLKDTSSVEAIK